MCLRTTAPETLCAQVHIHTRQDLCIHLSLLLQVVLAQAVGRAYNSRRLSRSPYRHYPHGLLMLSIVMPGRPLISQALPIKAVRIGVAKMQHKPRQAGLMGQVCRPGWKAGLVKRETAAASPDCLVRLASLHSGWSNSESSPAMAMMHRMQPA